MTLAPLADVRVLDLSRLLPGPFCTRLLADLGAEVLRVEPPEGDYVTTLMPGLYEFLNRGKRAIRVDLKNARGRELVLALIARADVVVESFRPGVVDRLGVGFDAARARRPDVVYASISGFGQDGPRRDQPGHDIAYEAAGGAFGGVVAAGIEPTAPHLPVADLGAASLGALDIVAAVRARDRDGAGAEAVHIDVSLQEAVMYLAATRWGRFLGTGAEPRLEDLANFAPGHGIVTTRDGAALVLGAIEDKFWTALCVGLDLHDLVEPPFDSHAGRMHHRGALVERLAARVAELDRDDVLARLRSADVPVDEVASVTRAAADPHLRTREAIVERADGTLRLEHPVRQNRHRGWCRDQPPDPVADLAAVLEELGLSDVDRAAVVGSGAVLTAS